MIPWQRFGRSANVRTMFGSNRDRRRRAGWALAVLLLPAAAAASTPRARVAAHKKAAFRLFEQGDYAGGIEEMEAAHALLPHPGFLLNIAVAYERWGGRCVEALTALDRFDGLCDRCELTEAGRRRRDSIEAVCATDVSVRSEPPGARLVLDGQKRVGTAPATVSILPGRHSIRAELDGYVPAEQSFEVRQDAGPSLVLRLAPEVFSSPALAPPEQPAILGIERPPSAEPNRGPAASGPSAWTVLALGVGAAGLGAGAYFTVTAFDRIDAEARGRRDGSELGELLELRSDAEAQAVAAHVGFGIGLLGVGIGLLSWLLDGPSSPPEPPRVGLRF